MFNSKKQKCQCSKADGGVYDDYLFLGEGDDEGIHVAFHLAGHGKEAGGLVPAAEFEQPGACEQHAGCGRGDAEKVIGDAEGFFGCETAKKHIGRIESKVHEGCELHDSRSLA